MAERGTAAANLAFESSPTTVKVIRDSDKAIVTISAEDVPKVLKPNSGYSLAPNYFVGTRNGKRIVGKMPSVSIAAPSAPTGTKSTTPRSDTAGVIDDIQDISSNPEAAGVSAVTGQTAGEVARDPFSALAPAAAMAASEGFARPGAGLLRRFAAPYLGAIAGEGAHQVIHPAPGATTMNKVVNAENAGWGYGIGPQLFGEALALPLNRLMTGRAGLKPPTAPERAAREYGLPIPYAKQLPTRDLSMTESFTNTVSRALQSRSERAPMGHEVMDTARAEVGEKVTTILNNMVEDIAGSADKPRVRGQRVQAAIPDISKPIFDRTVRSLQDNFLTMAQGEMVDMTQMKLAASRDMNQIAHDVAIAPNTNAPHPTKLKIIHDILAMPDRIPMQDAVRLRSRYLGLGDDNVITTEAPATAKFYSKRMTEAIDATFEQARGNYTDEGIKVALGVPKTTSIRDLLDQGRIVRRPEGMFAIKGFPEARDAWKQFRFYTREGAQVLQGKTIRTMLQKDPEKIADMIIKDGPTRALQLRYGVLGIAERSGDPRERMAAQQSWDQFRSLFVEKKLMSGNIFALNDRLEQVGDETLRVIFDMSPRSNVPPPVGRRAAAQAAAARRGAPLEGDYVERVEGEYMDDSKPSTDLARRHPYMMPDVDPKLYPPGLPAPAGGRSRAALPALGLPGDVEGQSLSRGHRRPTSTGRFQDQLPAGRESTPTGPRGLLSGAVANQPGFSTTSAGAQQLARIRDLAAALESVRHVQSEQGGLLRTMLEGIPSYVYANLRTNPTLNSMLLRGINGAAREAAANPNYGAARRRAGGATAFTMAAVSPRLAHYIAQVGRAWQLYEQAAPTNPQVAAPPLPPELRGSGGLDEVTQEPQSQTR